MKETLEKQVIYTEKTFPELLSSAMAGDRDAAAEIIRRQEAQKAEIESLKVKAAGKARTPKAEKTPQELAESSAYFRTALLAKQFGMEHVTLNTLTVASAYLDCGLAQGNLRQALNRVQQVLKGLDVEEEVFPQWIWTAAGEIPVLDENRKLEEESDKVEQIQAIIQKYMAAPAAAPAAPAAAPAAPAAAPAAPAAAPAAPAAPAKKGAKK